MDSFLIGERMGDYFSELDRTMTWLGNQPRVKFIGQSVLWDGHALFKSMTRVPEARRLELPVFEDFQFGMSIGLALEGWIPVNVYPRCDFLIMAANQITNHLANVRLVSDGQYKPRVITRVSVGATEPLHPGPQHCQDHTEALRLLCRGEIEVVELRRKEQIFTEYERALLREDARPTILVEYAALYHTQSE
jgi:pyruvate/2-oxoglutarate/acetoin dehydrogenase E1 component